MDVLDAMIRYGVSLSRSVELTVQWDKILAFGPMYPVFFLMIFLLIEVWAPAQSFLLSLVFIAVLVISSIGLWFIVVMRRFGSGGIGFGGSSLSLASSACSFSSV